MRIAVVGRFEKWPWGQFPDEAYLARGLELQGATVFRVDQARPALPPDGVDWALFTPWRDSIRWLEPWKRLTRTVLWTLDWLPDFRDRSFVIQAAYEATCFVTSDLYPWESAYGITNHEWLHGACEDIPTRFDPKPEIPCAFIGSLYNDRRKIIASVVREFGGEIPQNSTLWGEDLARYVQRVKVVIGDNYRNDVPGYWSSRNYVIPGAGGFLLTPKVPALERHFLDGETIAQYSDLDGMRVCLEFWLENDKKREALRKRSFEHVHAYHNWPTRAGELLRILSRWS